MIKNSLIDFQNLVKLINEIAKFDSFNVSYDNILDLIFYFLFNSERHNEIHIYEKMLQIPNKTIYSFVSRWQMKSKRENIGWETTMVLKGSDYDYGSDYDNSIEAINAYVMTDSIEDTTYDVTNDDISYAYYDECEKGGFIEKIRYLFYTKNSDNEEDTPINYIIDFFYHISDYLEGNREAIKIDENGKVILQNKLNQYALPEIMKGRIRFIANEIIKCEFDNNLHRKVNPVYNPETLSPNWHITDFNAALYFALFYRDSKRKISLVA